MKSGRYSKRKGVATKTLVLALAVMLIVGCTVGGTLAWLTASTDEVKNTFTVGDINLILKEHKLNEDGSLDSSIPVNANSYKVVPGATLNKRPYVTVVANSEACWLFIEVIPANNTISGLTGDVIAWEIASGWTKLTGVSGVDNVWYKQVSAEDAKNGITYEILKDNQVTVNDGLTKAMINASGFAAPTLTFNAYAIQSANLKNTNGNAASVADAWNLVKG